MKNYFDIFINYMQRQTIYLSLFMIAVNPFTERGHDVQARDESYNEAVYTQGKQSVSASDAQSITAEKETQQKILDYYKLGRLYLLQGDFTQSQKAFSMGDYLEDVSSYYPSDKLVQKEALMNPILTVPAEYDSGTVKEDNLDSYLEELITLYLNRVEMLVKNPDYRQEALKELQKVYIIDPENQKARFLENIIRTQYDKQEQNDVKGNSGVSQVSEPKQSIKYVSAEYPVHTTENPTFQVKPPKNIVLDKRLIDVEQEKALVEAESLIASSILNMSLTAEEELQLKECYERGKEYLQNEEYIQAIVALKKVLAINSHHFYAEYARRLISEAMKKIKEREEAYLARICDGETANTATRTAAIESQPLNINDVDVVAHDPAAMAAVRKQEILKENIKNVLTSIHAFIKNGDYQKAYKNIAMIMQLDPDNAEAGYLKQEVDNILNERAAQQQRAEEILKQQEEERKRQVREARIEKRTAARSEVERTHRLKTIDYRDALQSVLTNKIQRLLQLAKDALSEKDFIKTKDLLEFVFQLDQENAEGKALESSLKKQIYTLKNLFEAPESEGAERVIETEGPQDSSNKNESKEDAEVSAATVTAVKPISDMQTETVENKDLLTPQPEVKSEGNGVFKKLCNLNITPLMQKNLYMPETMTVSRVPIRQPKEMIEKVTVKAQTSVANKQPENQKTVSVLDAITGIRPATNARAKNAVPEFPEVKQQVNGSGREKNSATRDGLNYFLNKANDEQNDRSAEIERNTFSDNTLERYIMRGVRHFKQENYPLALVTFNKVKTLDKENHFVDEVDTWIMKTKEQLEER